MIRDPSLPDVRPLKAVIREKRGHLPAMPGLSPLLFRITNHQSRITRRRSPT